MEHRVAEDRPCVVVEAHEARDIEPVRVVHAQDEPVEQRIQEERGEDRQRGDEEQEVDRAFATPAAEPGGAESRPGHVQPVAIRLGLRLTRGSSIAGALQPSCRF